MNKVWQHIFVWFGIYAVYTMMMSLHNDLYRVLLINLLHVLLYASAYYLLLYVQVPYLYDQKKKGWFVLSLLTSSIVLYGIWRLGLWGLEGIRGITSRTPYVPLADYLIMVIRFYSPAMALWALESHFQRKKERSRVRRLEKEKMANELKFLKAQINPHFLFNTLNNLYAYVLTESPKAPDMILRLSGMLDYVLYKSQQQSVPLKEEIQTIENFIGLEKIRYGERLEVRCQVEGDTTLPVSPLLLLSLVENAFKHGASGDIDYPKINIHLWARREKIQFEVSNTKSQYNGELNDAYKKGIGLSNIKRQLDLVYPQDHQIRIEDLEKTFKVFLILNPNA
ncbi:MAG: sensor histidine kinase [Bacteroidota bacterium]